MGSNNGKNDERPVHTVTVASFYMLKIEVSQAEYRRVMKANPSFFKGDSLPVEEVTKTDAIAYCNARSRMDGLKQCYSGYYCNFLADGYRLPTEAEYEYACRAGTNGDFSGDIDSTAW